MFSVASKPALFHLNAKMFLNLVALHYLLVNQVYRMVFVYSFLLSYFTTELSTISVRISSPPRWLICKLSDSQEI